MKPDGKLRTLPAASHVSEAVRVANPDLYGAIQRLPIEQFVAQTGPKATTKAPKKPRCRKPMNGTETAYSLILEARVRRGELTKWEREGITLRWPDGMTYSPDFYVLHPDGRKEFIEVKGPWIEEDALVKFRAARACWTEFFFAMWQLDKGSWVQIL